MAWRKRLWHCLFEELKSSTISCRHYSSKIDFKKLRPMILQRIQDRAKNYPVQRLVPVAYDVLTARELLIQGVSALLKVFPIQACKYCPEVYVGEKGHLICTCRGYRRQSKNEQHQWVPGSLIDILVPVETFHLHYTFQEEIKHQERFDYERIPAVVELCLQAGAKLENEHLSNSSSSNNMFLDIEGVESLSPTDVNEIAIGTLRAWEALRDGVQKLLLVYSAKVCAYCSEVHVGPSGHKVRLCGMFKHESWRGSHFWKKAEVDDLVPPKIVWMRRPQDPPLLLDEHRRFYGHAPAVIDLCVQAGAFPPSKYFNMMKYHGMSNPFNCNSEDVKV